MTDSEAPARLKPVPTCVKVMVGVMEPAVVNDNWSTSVGGPLWFGKWSGTEVKIDGQELLIMKESDIMGVLTDLPAAKKKAA